MADDLRENLFQLPIDPEQFSVLLPPAELRKLDFSALEFATARKAVIEYIKRYFPNDFNDFVSNNGIIMLVELLAYQTAVLSLRSDILSNEAFLPTARSTEAVANHLALIGQRINPATPATVNVECSVESPLVSDLRIHPADLAPFEIRGEDGKNISYEVYAAPDDFTSDIVIPTGKRGVIAYGIEGTTHTTTFASDGTESQTFVVNDNSILSERIKVVVQIGSTSTVWYPVDAIEEAGPTDEKYEYRIVGDTISIIFGNNVNGAIPHAGSTITLTYRTGGGVRGRIGSGLINSQRAITPDAPYTAPVLIRFRNPLPSTGGTDGETVEQAKKRAPRVFSTRKTAVTENDYANLAINFSHPAFGSVSKAVATVRTGLNANMVEVYVLADGPDGVPIQPSQGLKKALASYLDDLNVLTDTVNVYDGCIKPVDIRMTVVMHKNADASVVRVNVDDAITNFFDIANWDMGEPFYTSNLVETIIKIDGVSYVDLFSPADNILPSISICNDPVSDTTSSEAGSSGTSGSSSGSGSSGSIVAVDDSTSTVALNEVITLGDREIDYYYESSGR